MYFGLADEREDACTAHEERTPPTRTAALVRAGVSGFVAGVVIGLLSTILDGETITIGRVLSSGVPFGIVMGAFWYVEARRREHRTT